MTTVVLSDADLHRLRLVLARAAGLVFEDSRRDSLGYCIAERLRRTGLPDVTTYLALVEQPSSPELQPLIDEVTIQETHFFRNPPQVRAMRDHVLPELIRDAEGRGRRVRIWSAGCSTGDEPYTVAMMLRELLPSSAGWDVKVIATDISAGALAAAREATYGARAVQLASPDVLSRFFLPTADGRHQVRPEVRELVEFRHHNLVLDPPVGEGLDLILCRNVTIYFNRDTTRALVHRLHGSLRDGGYLFLGHSETLWQVSEDFRLVTLGSGPAAAFVYRRSSGSGEHRLPVLTDRRTAPPLPVALGERRLGFRRSPSRPELTGSGSFTGGAARAAPTAGVAAAPRSSTPTARPAASVPAGQQASTAPALSVGAVREALAAGRYEDAARLARLAADVEPLRAEAHYLQGLALVDLGRDAEALKALRRAVYLEPDAGLSHFLLAGALARTGDRAAAAREYRAAAQTLGREPADATAPELGGRSVRELAALCAQLEGQLARGLA